MSGYVRLYRSLFGHPAFRDESQTMAFAWMIGKASWRPTRVRYKGHSISLKRGQLAISQRDMATAFGRDKAWIERLWKRLKSEAMIEARTEAGVAVITICNYNEYQPEGDEREAANEARNIPTDEAAARQRRGTEQRREEGKEVSSEAKASSLRAWPCPIGVDPQHWRDFLKNRKTRRLTNSETAYRGQLRELQRLASDEWPPGRLVQYAAEKGWGSINDPTERDFRHDRRPHSEANDGLSSTARAGLAVFGR
jgi:hypothetical protein